jgi:hypothetical protein
MLRHIEVRGDSYERGLQIGRELQDAIRRRLDRDISNALLERCRQDMDFTHDACERKYPEFVNELRGVATGADVDFWKIFLLNCEELREAEGGCTDVAEVSLKHISLAHNEDTGGVDQPEDCALVTHYLKGLNFTAFTYAGELPGDAYSWNSHGFYFGVNYLKPLNPKPDPKRVPRDFTGRALVEAVDVEDGIQVLQNSPDASGYHYYMGSGDRIVSAEQYLDSVSLKEIAGIDVHANHYIHPKFANGAPKSLSSKFRQERAEELVKTGREAFEILVDRANAEFPVCQIPGDDGQTLSTAHFLPTENKVIIYTPSTLEKDFSFTLRQ